MSGKDCVTLSDMSHVHRKCTCFVYMCKLELCTTEDVENSQGFWNEQSSYFLGSLFNLSSDMFAVDYRLPNGFCITFETSRDDR